MKRGAKQKNKTGDVSEAVETGVVRKKWRNRIPICIVYPNTYYMGMSSLAVHILYTILNDYDEIVCERAFYDDMGHVRSIESGSALRSFRLIFVPLSFELDYINIPKLLADASIPVSAAERRRDDPIVIGGGICAMANPEPIAGFFDLFIEGDIEATIPDFIERLIGFPGDGRDLLIDDLGRFPWVYNPLQMSVSYRDDGTVASFHPGGYSVSVRHFRGRRLGNSSLATDRTEFSGMHLIEGSRGCPSRCAFCLLGNTYRVTYDSMKHIPEGVSDVGIVGGGVSFHPALTDTIRRLTSEGKRVHLPSLRIDTTPLEVIDLLKDGIKTLTFGIEAGSERLRRCIGKPVGNEEILQRTDDILSIKPFNLKLYFMAGLPGEGHDDIEAIVNLVKKVKHVMVKRGAKRGFVGSVTVHVSPFVPKPVTPFQWLAMEDMESLKDKITYLKKALNKVENTYFTHESVKFSLLQGILARGDRRIGPEILKLARGESFQKVSRESPVNLNFYVLRQRHDDEVFPWDFIGGTFKKEQLLRRLRKALACAQDIKMQYPHE